LAGNPPPQSSEKAPAKSADSKSGDAGDAGACGKFTVVTKSQLDGCNNKCKDDQRDQQRSCADPNCQVGIGNATRACLSKCEEYQKAAQKADCYRAE
jgi:hypothetical protein